MMHRLAVAAVVAVCAILSAPCFATINLNVDCNLDPSTPPAPPTFATLAGVQLHIRSLQPLMDDVVVTINGTCRPTTIGAPVLNFNSTLDGGGDSSFTVAYRGTSPQTAAISGGVHLDPSKWTPTENPGIYSYPLADVVPLLAPLGFGSIHNGGLGSCTHDKLELFAIGQPMILARYPNVGSVETSNGPWMDWMFVSRDSKNEHDSFLVEDLTVLEFLRTFARPNKVWLHGFWSFDWADNFIQLINVSAAIVRPGVKGARLTFNSSTPPVYGVLQRARFYAVNSFAALDMVGEYYIDEAAGTLYFMGTQEMLQSAVLNAASAPLVSFSAAVKGVEISALALRYGRSVAVEQSWGTGVVSNLLLSNLVIENMGRSAIALNNVANSTIDAIAAKAFGCAAVSVSGGNSATLTPANVVVSNSDVSLYSRWTRTYNPGFAFGGVGLTFINNFAHNAPHQGMTGGGNNLLFDSNRFDSLCWEVRDSGAWYIGRSWVHRGVVVQRNIFTNIVHVEPTTLGAGPVQAIYLDDEQSGVQVINNTFINVETGILLGGGRDNYLSGNVCNNVSLCIAFDNRGMNWQHGFCEYNASLPLSQQGELVQQLYSVHFTAPPYATEYPQLPGLLQNRPCVPVNNSVVNNVACGGTKTLVDRTDATIESWGSFIANNTVTGTC